MLVRLHGLLLAPPVIVWFIWQWYQHHKGQRRWGGVAPPPLWRQYNCRPAGVAQVLAAWLLAGVAVFFAGWPWLWLAPIARFQQYLASGTARQTLHVFYLGQVWNDRDVPWHYPWVMFAATVPVGLLVLGMLGIWARWLQPGDRDLRDSLPSPFGRGAGGEGLANCKLQNVCF